MTEQSKEVKVEFAPGCFDDFDGTQEELEALQAEIISAFANMTPEELEQRSRPVDDDQLQELIDEEPELVKRLLNVNKRTLQ
jgi:hypothetical protein